MLDLPIISKSNTMMMHMLVAMLSNFNGQSHLPFKASIRAELSCALFQWPCSFGQMFLIC